MKTGLTFVPGYVQLHQTGELEKRANSIWRKLGACNLCPRKCNANRLIGNPGICGANHLLEVSSSSPHFGEESMLVGSHGSGTIFFTNCSMLCLFCQNWEISQCGEGVPISIAELAEIMLRLQKRGCHNINLVSPDHYLPHILKALDLACSSGLRLPLVYNTGGWVLPKILEILNGVIDIYMPDFKYWSSDKANTYSPGAESYPDLCRNAILEMNNQVGVAKPNHERILERGLIIRHLVMPNNVAGSKEIISWIANNLPKDTYLNLLSQYYPTYKAKNHPKINRKITKAEYIQLIDWTKQVGLTNVEFQATPHE
jgi:putative pyruvate formate lyase activating enzyme